MDGTRSVSRSARLAAALLTIGLASAGCAQTAAPPVDDSRAELERLRLMLAEREQAVEQLHGKLALLEAGQRQMAERLAESEQRPAHDLARPSCEEQIEVQASRASVHKAAEARPLLRLHGESYETTSVRPRLGGADARELTASYQPPIVSERLAVAPVPSLPTRGALPAPAPEQSAIGESSAAEALYVQALDLVRRREFAAALRELDAFLRTFPADPRAVRALFWRGEVLYARREYASALTAYEDALERDPTGDKAPDTLLRVARCQLRLGAKDRARSTIAELRGKFPNSEAARAAAALDQEDT